MREKVFFLKKNKVYHTSWEYVQVVGEGLNENLEEIRAAAGGAKLNKNPKEVGLAIEGAGGAAGGGAKLNKNLEEVGPAVGGGGEREAIGGAATAGRVVGGAVAAGGVAAGEAVGGEFSILFFSIR